MATNLYQVKNFQKIQNIFYFSTIKQLRAKIGPWKRDNVTIDRRFNAPYIKSLHGKPMVFNAEQEKELYFQQLENQL